ncbi:MAG: FtsX-like permease family protein, partial [Bacteroidota bacterium]
PEIPLDYAFVDSRAAEQYGNERTMESLFLLFSSLSLFIACLGLFGLVTFMAEQKTKEIGIRKVLGATTAGIVGLLSKDFLRLVVVSLVIATPVAWIFMKKWLENFAYRIDIQWWVFVAAGLVAVAIAFLTVSFQSVKAALANPVKSLRSE